MNTVIRLAHSILFAIIVTFYLPCHANNLVEDAAAIITDPFKLARGSANMLEAVVRIQGIIKDLDRLEIRTNSDIEARIRDARGVVDRAIELVDRGQIVGQDLIGQLNSIANSIAQRAQALIESARCLVVNAGQEFNDALKVAALTLKEANPSINIFGISVIELRTREVSIVDPLIAFESIANIHQNTIKNFTKDTRAREFIHMYGEIIRLAKNAQCSYRGTAVAEWLESTYIVPFSDKADLWVTVVLPN